MAVVVLSVVVAAAHTTKAASIDDDQGPQLLIGTDADRQDHVAIQAGAATNQSLNRTDVLSGGSGNDVIFGLNGDVRLPTLRFCVPGFPQGIATADVNGLSNFCTIDESPLPGYDFLIRFRNAAGNIIVTVRVDWSCPSIVPSDFMSFIATP